MAALGTLLTIVHLIACFFLVGVVLLQSGRGGGMGAAFGGGGAQIFGGRGAGGFLAKLTTGLAVVFFLTSLTLSMLSSDKRSVVDSTAGAPKSADTTIDLSGGIAPAEGEAEAPADAAAPADPAAPGETPAPPAPPAGEAAPPPPSTPPAPSQP